MTYSIFQKIFDNKIRFIRYKTNMPISFTGLFFHYGKKDTPQHLQESLHLLEHMLFLPSKKQEDFISEMELQGLYSVDQVTLDYTLFGSKQKSSNIINALDFFQKRLLFSLDVSEIEYHKNILQKELSENEEDELSILWKKNIQELFSINLSSNKKNLIHLQKYTPGDIEEIKKILFKSEKTFICIDNSTESNENISKKVESMTQIFPLADITQHTRQSKIKKNTIHIQSESLEICEFTFRIPQEIAIQIPTIYFILIKEWLCGGLSAPLIQKMRLKHQEAYWVYSDFGYIDKNAYIQYTAYGDPKKISDIFNTFFFENLQKLNIRKELQNHKNRLEFILDEKHISLENIYQDIIRGVQPIEYFNYEKFINDIEKLILQIFSPENLIQGIIKKHP